MADTMDFSDMTERAGRIAVLLKQRGETIVIAESSAGGLIAAALLAVPGASAYFLGGLVVYTQKARLLQLGIGDLPEGMRASTEPYASLLARTARERFEATWSLAESGATGPGGNRYGDASGHCCLAIAGPMTLSTTVETGSGDHPEDRQANMFAFGVAALDLLEMALMAAD